MATSLFDDMEIPDTERYARSVNAYSISRLVQMVNDFCGGHRLVWSRDPQPFPGSMPNAQGQVQGFQFALSPEERIAALNESGTAADLFTFSYKWKVFIEDLMNALPKKTQKKYLDPLMRPGDPSTLYKDNDGKYRLPGVPDGYEVGQPDAEAGTVPFKKLPEEE